MRGQRKRLDGVTSGMRLREGHIVAVLLLAGLAACSGAQSPADDSVRSPSNDQDAKRTAEANPAAACSADEQVTGRDYAVKDEIVVQEQPSEDSQPILKPGEARNKDTAVYATINSSLPVREICRKGAWSKVRVLVPSYQRWQQGWVPSTALRKVDVDERGRRIYTAADVEWQPGSEAYKKPILKVINTIMRQDSQCEAIDDRSLLVEGSGKEASFLISCVGPEGDNSISFTAADASNGRSFAEPAPDASAGQPAIGKADAVMACEEATRRQLTQPKSADYHTFTDVTFTTNGSFARVEIGLDAKNGFGNTIEATAICEFEGPEMTTALLSQ